MGRSQRELSCLAALRAADLPRSKLLASLVRIFLLRGKEEAPRLTGQSPCLLCWGSSFCRSLHYKNLGHGNTMTRQTTAAARTGALTSPGRTATGPCKMVIDCRAHICQIAASAPPPPRICTNCSSQRAQRSPMGTPQRGVRQDRACRPGTIS